MTVQEICIDAIDKLENIERKMLRQEERIDSAFAQYEKSINDLMKANEQVVRLSKVKKC